MGVNEEENILVDVAKFEKKLIHMTNKRKLVIGLYLFFASSILLMNITYICSPLSKVKIRNLSGNWAYDEDKVLKIAGLSEKKSLLSVDTKKVLMNLNNSDNIETSHVSWHMTYLDIEIDEIAPIAKDKDNQTILSNGIYLDSYKKSHFNYEYNQENLNNLPVFTNYHQIQNSTPNETRAFLSGLKYLPIERYRQILSLEEFSIQQSDNIPPGIYFGIKFNLPNLAIDLKFSFDLVDTLLKNDQKLQEVLSSVEASIDLELLDNTKTALCYSENGLCKVVKYEREEIEWNMQ